VNTDNAALVDIARSLRRDVVDTVYKTKDGHPSPALSAADIVTALFFRVMRLDPKNPAWEERDRFILSKGHACPVVYAALARLGYFPREELPTLRQLGSCLQGHPDMKKTPGIDMTTGSLGNGISIGTGMALAARYKKLDYYTYVITGDGELEEGIIWEAAMAAVKHKLDNLIVFVDHNGLQSGGPVGEVSGLIPVLPKFEAFRWYCQEIDGHDIGQILAAVDKAKAAKGRPSVIVARTVKGRGVPYMEKDNSWHKRVPTEAEWREAMELLGGVAK
jgi:Transketolase, N-terminal subunit